MKEKKSVSRALAARYRVSTKRQKRVILDEFVQLMGYHRVHARRVLRQIGRPTQRFKEVLPRISTTLRQYGVAVVEALRKIWGIADGICGKRLAPALSKLIPVLEKHGEIHLDESTRRKLLTISAATIDRVLASDRKRLKLKGRSWTKPGSLLKHQIPIRTFADWNEAKPGFLEIDLVGHDGGNLSGDFAQTLDATDVQTQWTETEAVANKAQRWVFAALQDIRARLPFDVLGLDSDNGSEFINAHLLRYCTENKITFTRGRSYRKNDSCHVEQKNYSVVRRFVGYRRYDTDEEVILLNDLYRSLRLYTNFFMPSMKLQNKTRHGSKVKKIHDQAKTPFERVLESPEVPDTKKRALKRQYAQLNPAELKRQMTRIQTELLEVAKKKEKLREQELAVMQKQKAVPSRKNESSKKK